MHGLTNPGVIISPVTHKGGGRTNDGIGSETHVSVFFLTSMTMHPPSGHGAPWTTRGRSGSQLLPEESTMRSSSRHLAEVACPGDNSILVGSGGQ